MSQLLSEQLVTLNQAAKLVPGGPVHLSTMHRWHLRGVHGVRLETIVAGGKRRTSKEAIERFVIATTKAANGCLVSTPSASRQSAVAAAERRLAAAGI